MQKAGAELVEVNFQNVIDLIKKCDEVFLYYGTKEDISDYLKKYKIPLTLEQLFEQIASPDVKLMFKEKVCRINTIQKNMTIHLM